MTIIHPSLRFDFRHTRQLGPRPTFTRNTTATYTDRFGVLTSAVVNQPRFDFDLTTGLCLGLLIEGQRTNYLLNSQSPVNQTVTLSTGTYTLSMSGTGSVSVAGNTAIGSGFGSATASTPVTFTIVTGGTVDVAITGSVSLFQLENGAHASSHIPTTGSQQTRSADLLTLPTSGWFNAAEGTFLVEASCANVADDCTILAANNGSQNEQIDQRFAITSMSSRVRKSGTNEASMTALGSAPVANTVYRIATAYKENSCAAVVNGGAVATDSLASMPTGITTLAIGSRTSQNFLNGHMRRLMYFPRRLSNSELQSLTA